METRRALLFRLDGREAWFGPALLLASSLLAYWMLWLAPIRYGVEGFLFIPGALPAPVVLGFSAWLLWRRFARLSSLTDERAMLLAISLVALGSGLFVWALLTRKIDLLLPSLAANGLGFAAAVRGRSGCRSMVLPAMILLLGVQIPKPLEDETVWHLQVWTASWAGGLLQILGRDFLQSGVILRGTEQTFHVIDSCSGLNGIAILTGIALIVRELLGDAGRRTWLLVAGAPLLGFALNVARVAYVAAGPENEALTGVDGDHTPQGLAVIMAGTGILYALGWALSSAPSRRRPSAAPHTRVGPGAFGPWAMATGWLAALAVLSWTLPPFPEIQPTYRTKSIELPDQKSGWTSDPAPRELFFTGVFTRGLHRRYQLDGGPNRPPEVVELLVGYENLRRPDSTRLFSSKLLVPGPEWGLTTKGHRRLWRLDREAEFSVTSRKPGGESALTYAWRPRDEGLCFESWRSLLALERSPLRRDERRAVVRLVSYAPHDGQLALDLAGQRLDRFLKLFRSELAAL
jgi:exosortase